MIRHVFAARDKAESSVSLARRIAVGTLCTIALLGAFFQPLRKQFLLAHDPHRINDDARQQVVPFLRDYRGPAGERYFQRDYIVGYYAAAMPVGLRVMYYATAIAHLDPRPVSKAIPLLLLPIMVIALAVAGRKLGGWPAGLISAAWVLTAGIFIERMVGGIPRSFAFPLMAVGAMALVLGRPWLLCLTTIAAASLYPAGAVTLGLALAAMLLVMPPEDRGRARDWRFSRRLLCIVAGATGCILAIIPTSRALRTYGPLIDSNDTAHWPELKAGERYSAEDLPGQLNVWQVIADGFDAAFEPPYDWTRKAGVTVEAGAVGNYLPVSVMRFVGLSSLILVSIMGRAGRRLLVLFVASLAAVVLARTFSPYLYLPQRHTIYPMPVVLALAVPAAMGYVADAILFMLKKLDLRTKVRPIAMIACCGAMLVWIGAGRERSDGYSLDFDANLPMHRFIRTLPTNAMIAGFPRGGVDNIPYFDARPVFLNSETHQVFHEAYAERIRDRAWKLLYAYYSPDVAMLRDLHDAFHVTHLIVARDQFGPKSYPKLYFQPYGAAIEKWHAALGGALPASLRSEAAGAVVFDDGVTVILDLARLPDASSATTSASTRPTTAVTSR